MKFRAQAIIAGCIMAAMTAAGTVQAQTAAPDSTARADTTAAPALAPADTTRAATAADTLRTITVQDSLGIPGRLEGQIDPEATKHLLQTMSSNQVSGSTQWERQKNPKVAMLCHTLLPGLGQVYNGRRLKVGLMVGFASYYYGTTWLSYKKWKGAEFRRDQYEPGSRQYLFENDIADFYKEQARTYLWWSGATWLLGLLDVWIDAHLYDVRSFTPPPPPDTPTPHAVNQRTNYLTLGFTLERSK